MLKALITAGAMLLAIAMPLLWQGAACAATEEDTPWKVRRPADNTVLPLEYVHRPDASATADQPEIPATPETAGPAPASAKPAPPKPEQAKSAPAKPAVAKPAPQAPPVAAGGTTPTGRLELRQTGEGMSLSLPLSGGEAKTKYFRLDNPIRLVVDVLGPWRNGGPNVYRPESPYVEKIVLGEHPGALRLVIYLTDQGRRMADAPKITASPDGVRISLVAIP
ncbi:MAG: AMIN domain-containing protein [Desulfovibrionaceae bacterium]